MPDHLRFFALEKSPFEAKGQSQVVLGTRALRDAFGAIQSGLADGASRICVSGESGLGKTSLARALPKLLGDAFRVAIVPDPSLSWASLRDNIARQWGIEEGGLARPRLVEAAGRARLVLVIDQAERVSEEFLDHLDVVLCYRTEDDAPAVQSVLLARLATEPGESPSPLLWWLDRLQTLQLEFAPIPREGVPSYIQKHLRRAGWRGEQLFEDDAAHAIHASCDGVPGRISDLCEALLVAAADAGHRTIDARLVEDFEQGRLPRVDPVEEGPWTLDAALVPDEDAPPVEDDSRIPVEKDAGPRPPVARNDALPGPAATAPAPSAETTVPMPTPAGLSRAPEMRPFQPAGELDPLDAPPSPEELREILGGGLRRHVPLAAGLAALVLVGGMAMALLSADEEAGPGDPTRIEIAVDTSAISPEPRNAAAGPVSRGPIDDSAEASSILFVPGGYVVPEAAEGGPNGPGATRPTPAALASPATGGSPAAPVPSTAATRPGR